MKLLIAGSRSITHFNLSEYVMKDVSLIISGGAEGIDTLAEEYADRHRISKLILRPRYDLYGRSAPLRRNEMMVELADAVLVIWDGVSRGAVFTIRCAEKKGKKIDVVTISSQC